jgi:hypothetical protein
MRQEAVTDGGSVQGDTDAITSGRVGVQARSVIATGQVSMEAENLTRVREDLDRLLGRYGGTVTEERTSSDRDDGPTRSTLVLRVPSARFDEVMSAFDDIATVTETQREEVDVTTEVIDVDARVRTAEVSLRRLRAFLGRAKAIETVIRLEAEISRREADLASLRAQQDYLDDQTSLATISVTLQTPGAGADPQDPLEDAGFLAGLRNGWNALLDILVVTATVVGALVPFAIVLGVVLAPLLVWLRSRRRQPAAPPATPAAPAG